MEVSPRLLLPGLVPREPGLETYWVRPGGVTAVRLAAGDRIDVVDRQGMQPAELTALGPERALGVAQDAPATTVRALARCAGDGARAVLAALTEHGADPSAATAARLFGEWSPAGARESFTAADAAGGPLAGPAAPLAAGARVADPPPGPPAG